jgi:hypothetical protein
MEATRYRTFKDARLGEGDLTRAELDRALILDCRPATEILAGGTTLLRAGALAKARAGVTTLAEANRVTFAE